MEEGRERLRAGIWLLIREASSARNLKALLPLAHEYGPHRMAFCTDDREPEHVADDGHVNAIVRDAVAIGLPAGGRHRDGLTQPGYLPRAGPAGRHRARPAADILVLCDLESFLPELVLKRGKPVVDIAPITSPTG